MQVLESTVNRPWMTRRGEKRRSPAKGQADDAWSLPAHGRDRALARSADRKRRLRRRRRGQPETGRVPLALIGRSRSRKDPQPAPDHLEHQSTGAPHVVRIRHRRKSTLPSPDLRACGSRSFSRTENSRSSPSIPTSSSTPGSSWIWCQTWFSFAPSRRTRTATSTRDPIPRTPRSLSKPRRCWRALRRLGQW